MTDRDDEDKQGFLKRWSRLKIEEADRQPPATVPPAGPPPAVAPPAVVPPAVVPPAVVPEKIAEAGAPAKAETADGPEPAAAVPFDPADLPDIDSLDKDSDYTGFLKDGVPAELRRLALRKLWRSDPALAVLDGLNDYDEDFTLAKVAEKIVSSYKPGRGYVDDEEDEIEDGDIEDEGIEIGEIEDGAGEDTEVADAEIEEAGEKKGARKKSRQIKKGSKKGSEPI